MLEERASTLPVDGENRSIAVVFSPLKNTLLARPRIGISSMIGAVAFAFGQPQASPSSDTLAAIAPCRAGT